MTLSCLLTLWHSPAVSDIRSVWQIQVVACLNVLRLIALWRRNLNYWDSVSTLAGEVPNPAKTFPKALFGAVVLVTTTYALPLIVGLGVTTDIADWKLGYFASLAKQVQP